MGKSIRRRGNKRLPAMVKNALFRRVHPDQGNSINFIHDNFLDGSTYRLPNVTADDNREILAIEVHTSLPTLRVTSVLECIKAVRPLPKITRVDNSSEFISAKHYHWCPNTA